VPRTIALGDVVTKRMPSEHDPSDDVPSMDGSYLRSRGWLASTDHKRIALLYLATLGVVASIGLAYALVLGLERARSGAQIVDEGDFARALSIHGIVMVFLVVIPAIPATIGNFVLPLALGARNLAFPRLSRAALRLYWTGASIALAGLVVATQRAGWTFRDAYDASRAEPSALWVMVGVLLVSASGLLNGINFVVTIHKLRAPGMTFRRLPFIAWAAYAASAIAILTPAPLATATTLVAAERSFHVGVFDPALGGEPLLFRHLFWAHAHPALFGSVLWGIGIAGEVLAAHARRPLRHRSWLPYLLFIVAFLSFTQWSLHMVDSGESGPFATSASLLALLALAPLVLVMRSMLSALRGGSVSLDAPMTFALVLAVDLAVWMASGVALDMLGLGNYLRNTSFEVAHQHYGLAGGTLVALFAGLYHWWPKLTGRLANDELGRLSALGIFVGVNLTFFAQFVVGLAGTPRGVSSLRESLSVLGLVSGVGACVLVGAIGFAIYVLVASLRSGARARPDPWGGGGLEWQTTSPPPPDNFSGAPVLPATP